MKIIAIGAHPDDIEIGCGGSLKQHSFEGDEVYLIVMTNGGRGGDPCIRQNEAIEASKVLGAKDIFLLGYEDTNMPLTSEPIFEMEKIISKILPDRVYIPYKHEIHQDHRRTFEISVSACRNVGQILMYEGPSTFNDFQVNYWIDIKKTLKYKIKSIFCHVSQGSKQILKIQAIKSMNLYRGYQARTAYAEGFAVFRFVEKNKFLKKVINKKKKN
jgi:LmbE family N-acetylglucosaminyl deacetylase